MRYMILLYGPDLPDPGTPEAAKMYAEWAATLPTARDGKVEVRPFLQVGEPS
jgi:hypothetical protein